MSVAARGLPLVAEGGGSWSLWLCGLLVRVASRRRAGFSSRDAVLVALQHGGSFQTRD